MPFAFDEIQTRDIDGSAVSSYLSYPEGEGFSPVLFSLSDGRLAILGSSGSLRLFPVGDGCFLCAFDCLAVLDEAPVIEVRKDGSGGITSIVLLLDYPWIDRKENIAYMDMRSGKAYLLNRPSMASDMHDSDDLRFLLSGGNENSFGYSDNRVFLLTEDGTLYSFEKDNPLSYDPSEQSPV